MESASGKSIAFFDFDGTITSKDTLAEIIKFSKGKLNYYTGLLILSPILISYKTGLISNHCAKEMMLRFFFKGTDSIEFNKICTQFTQQKLPDLIRQQALKTIQDHLHNNTKIVVVSASPVNWVSPWCKQYNIDCIATRLEIKNNKITGKILGRNCSGEEKVNCIKAQYNLTEFEKIYAYGDTSGDLPMLALSTHKFYKPFKERIAE